MIPIPRAIPAATLAVLLAAAVPVGAAFAQAPAAPTAAQVPAAPSAAQVLERIAANGDLYFADAAADLAQARARLAGARAGLMPKASVLVEGERYDSTLASVSDKVEGVGGLEVVQPIYDFGQTFSHIDAAEADEVAAGQALAEARNTVLLEGLALYYDLHASDLQVQALNERHASAYVRWERAKERAELGQRSAVEVAEWLARVEESRLRLYQERARNMELRLRLAELTGLPFDKEMINAPKGPAERPPEPEAEAVQALAEARNPALLALAKKVESSRLALDGTGAHPRIEAFGAVNQHSRPSTTRDDWTVGARFVWPFYDGGASAAERGRVAAEVGRAEAQHERARLRLRRDVRAQLLARTNAWQQLVAARARFDFAKKRMLRRQRLYSQERVTDLGPAMIEFTEAEADMVRAAGTFRLAGARLAVLVGEAPGAAFDDDFIGHLLGPGADAAPAGGYTPKGGSGFGHEDQQRINRKAR